VKTMINWLLRLVGVLALVSTTPAAAPSPAPALRIVSDRVLPLPLTGAEDVRWATERSVYLTLGRKGTVEAAVDPSGPPPREMVPGADAVGGWSFNRWVAASSEYLVVAGGYFGLTWRSLATPLRKEMSFAQILDVDVAGGRLLILATRRDEKSGKYAPDGTIAWIGSLDKGLADLHAVLTDARGAGAPNLLACDTFEMGAVRFLAGGRFLVVPGVQPGAHLFDSTGRLLRTWDTAEIGLDSDCAALTKEQVARMQVDFDARVAWLNQRHILDEILPLPQGPGLVIRSIERGRTHWHVKVLGESGSVTTWDLPISTASARSHLRADVRGRKVVFLVVTYQESMSAASHPPARLVEAELPGR